MAEKDQNSVRVQVAGANERDVGKGVARIGRQTCDKLGIAQGDIIEITGGRTTAAIALYTLAEDEGLDIIRIDSLVRANANVGMGDYVEIRKADVKDAKRVSLAPAQKNVRLMGSGQSLLRTLN